MEQATGRVITFYSYKGGTGRSMALANTAWVLASNGCRVLAIDWDLEAPGLHRYFAPFLVDKELTATEGLINFLMVFEDFAVQTFGGKPEGELPPPDWFMACADILPYIVSLEWEFPGTGTLDLLAAGKQGPSYSRDVSFFKWQRFYEKFGGGTFLEVVKEGLRAEYDYILIDSRTGVSDTSGICTVQLPDDLVICFTLNNQSIDGAAHVAESAYDQRLAKAELHNNKVTVPRNSAAAPEQRGNGALAAGARGKSAPLRVFPVPMRIEHQESARRDKRKEYAKDRFARFPAHFATRRERDKFQEEVQFEYLGLYAYEEMLATFGNKPSDEKGTLLRPTECLAKYLTDGRVVSFAAPPEESERQRVLAIYAGRAPASAPDVAAARAAFIRLSPAEQAIAQRVLLRLVKLARPEEGGKVTPVQYKFDDLDAAAQAVAEQLAAEQVVVIEADTDLKSVGKWNALESAAAASAASESSAPVAEERARINRSIRLRYDSLPRNWTPLRAWLEDRERQRFLLWRQQLNGNIAEWLRLDKDTGALISGAPLRDAIGWLNRCDESAGQYDLSGSERDYINLSLAEEDRQLRERLAHQDQAKRESANLHRQQVDLQLASDTFQRQRTYRRSFVVVALLIGLFAAMFSVLQYRRQTAQAEDKREAARLMQAGNDAMSKNNLDESIALYNQAIAKNSEYDTAYYNRGLAYFREQKYQEALADLDRSIALNANYAPAYVERGNIYYEQRNYDRALAEYNRALELDPNFARAYVNRGNVYAAKTDFAKALADYNEALRLNPNDTAALTYRGALHAQQKQYDQAITDFNAATSLKPDMAETYLLRGDTLASRNGAGDLAKAITNYDQAILFSDYDVLSYFSRAEAYRRLGEPEKALADYLKARDLNSKQGDDEPINEQINQGIKLVSAGSVPSYATSPINPRIYVHYQNASDAKLIDEIWQALKKQPGYTMSGRPALVTQPTSGDVRYFYDEDLQTAQAVKATVEKVLSSRKIARTLELRPLKSLAYKVPQGWIEVWLPMLQTPTLSPRINTPISQPNVIYRDLGPIRLPALPSKEQDQPRTGIGSASYPTPTPAKKPDRKY